MSFINNIININNNNINNINQIPNNINDINQIPNNTIIYDTFINSPNTSLSIPLLVVNDNINNEDEPPPLVEDIEDILYGFITRYVTVNYSRNRVHEIVGLTRETMVTRKFNIAINIAEQNDKLLEIECNICYEIHNNENFIKLNCNHEFCKGCVKKILKSCRIFNDPCCAYCREQIITFTYKNETVQTEFCDLIS
jgi:hypothetical protein